MLTTHLQRLDQRRALHAGLLREFLRVGVPLVVGQVLHDLLRRFCVLRLPRQEQVEPERR
ncbi:MAG TPA: hypothetical protein VMZ71_03955 [Gemmataceae bacterium]|nr:hypothetical protein [Gemmataceae bacterium]